MNDDTAKALTLSPFAVFLISTLLSVIAIFLGLMVLWIKKNYSSLIKAKKELNDAQDDFKDFKSEIEKELIQSKLTRKEEHDKLVLLINTKLKESLKRLWERIDENRGMLSSLLDKLAKSMETYDEKMFNLEKRLKRSSITRDEYIRELSAIKDTFYKELVDIQKSLYKVDSLSEFKRKNKNHDIEKIISNILEINQKLIDVTNGIANLENRVELNDKKIKNNNHLMREYEQRNVTKHQLTKKIIQKMSSENNELIDRMSNRNNETIKVLKNTLISKIEEIASRGIKNQKNGDNKIEKGKIKNEISETLGRIIKKD